MAAVTTVRRSILPLPALTVLAARADVPLRSDWTMTGFDEADVVALLTAAGLVDRDGAPVDDVATALEPLRAPRVSVEVALAPTTAHRTAQAGEPEALTCFLALSTTGLVGLLRRDGTPLAELTLAGGDALHASIERVLAAVPVGEPGPPVEARIGAEAFAALSLLDGRLDVDELASVHAEDVERVAVAAELLGTTTSTLRVVVVGDRRLTHPPIGVVLLYRTGAGWVEATVEDDEVVLRSRQPLEVRPAVASLLGGAL